MENYISINAQKIELTEDQIKQILAAVNQTPPTTTSPAGAMLSSFLVGDIVKIGEHEMVVLEHLGDATALIRKDLLPASKEFGEDNNYESSYVDCECEVFANDIAAIVGEDNIVLHDVDLTSDDGLKDYGKAELRRASLLTAPMYRRYVETLDKYKPDAWWWLATAYSTEAHGCTDWVKCVSPSGCVGSDYCGDVRGVRPFCILKSHIFVSQ